MNKSSSFRKKIKTIFSFTYTLTWNLSLTKLGSIKCLDCLELQSCLCAHSSFCCSLCCWSSHCFVDDGDDDGYSLSATSSIDTFTTDLTLHSLLIYLIIQTSQATLFPSAEP